MISVRRWHKRIDGDRGPSNDALALEWTPAAAVRSPLRLLDSVEPNLCRGLFAHGAVVEAVVMSDLCSVCGLPIRIGDYPCISVARPHQRGINGAIGDECDLVQENGFATPTRFRSKQELKRALAEQGLEINVRHVPLPGSDKSPYTTDWSRGCMDPYTLENGRILAERQAHTKASGPVVDESQVSSTWTIQEVK